MSKMTSKTTDYQVLDGAKIVGTIDRLANRINERFPDSEIPGTGCVQTQGSVSLFPPGITLLRLFVILMEWPAIYLS